MFYSQTLVDSKNKILMIIFLMEKMKMKLNMNLKIKVEDRKIMKLQKLHMKI